MCFGAGDFGAGAAEAQQKQQQAAVNAAMGNVDKAFAGYDQAFYDKRAQDYVDAATPKVLQDYQQTKAQTGFKLANQGLVQSSAGGRLGDLLARELSTQKQNVVDTGRNQANTLQRQIEQYRNQVVGQIQQSVNPAATAQSALQGAATIAAPSAVAPLTNVGNAFGNWAQQYLLANQAATNPQFAGAAVGTTPIAGDSTLPTGTNFGYQ